MRIATQGFILKLMVKIFTTLVLIFSILLFPPAVLAFISQDTVPGDRLYPVKRSLESGIVFIASLNPTTKAWFSTTRSKRRFEESSKLIAKGDTNFASASLKELVSQTSLAVTEVNSIKDVNSRSALAQNLLKAIDEYDQGLEEAKRQIKKNEPPEASPEPTLSPTPTTRPTATPRVTPTPTPAPPGGGGDIGDDIDDAQRELERERERIKALLDALAAGTDPGGATQNLAGEEEDPEDPNEDNLDPEAWKDIFDRLFGSINEHGQGSNQGE